MRRHTHQKPGHVWYETQPRGARASPVPARNRAGCEMRPFVRSIAGLLPGALMAAATAFGQTTEAASAGLRAADSARMSAYAAKDLERTLAFCDDQASLLAPNNPIAIGKTAIGKLIAGDFVLGDLTWHAEKAGAARSGDLGYTSGTYAMKVRTSAGRADVDSGKYLTVWKRGADGAWKVLFDTFNSDLPASP
jgi:ketosteroid isomerase-like protein